MDQHAVADCQDRPGSLVEQLAAAGAGEENHCLPTRERAKGLAWASEKHGAGRVADKAAQHERPIDEQVARHIQRQTIRLSDRTNLDECSGIGYG